MTRKTLPARFDTIARLINGPQFVAVILQIMRPPPEPGCDFQNRARRQTLANPRKNCAGPLRGRAAPRLRPFLARLCPIVLHAVEREQTISYMSFRAKRRMERVGRATRTVKPRRVAASESGDERIQSLIAWTAQESK